MSYYLQQFEEDDIFSRYNIIRQILKMVIDSFCSKLE